MPRTDLSHEDLMVWMRELPQPSYPWPFMITPSCTITNTRVPQLRFPLDHTASGTAQRLR
ncbi:hypothetical protein V7968_26065 [Nocardia vulneris]|uniref:hypothetical protein n=1 Tax=Nocardia vulneris TaxID=1141657 RepID=UPI0030D1F2AC